jgi:methylenetetrahydrofolate--tRNA-(uracil-5-)-methyltransferase
MGALAFYVANANPQHYQPSNITFGIMPPLISGSGRHAPKKKKMDRKLAYSERALAALESWIAETATVTA